jgi:ADP-ribosylglycohydrolase
MLSDLAASPSPATPKLFSGLPGLVNRGIQLDAATYRDKVLGCWHGKNIGGTLGGPLEEKFGRDELFNVDWYPELPEGGIPNDDIELQLLWLQAIQEKGPGLTARQLADYWLDCVRYNFDEYGLSKANLVRGLAPPVSGWHNNWFRDCMGSPIRSEIWACLAPGTPEIAARYAFEDAICDHGGGESVYGEIFNAVMQSCAFIEPDREKLIEVGLSAIPPQTKTSRAIARALEFYGAGVDWVEARNRIKTEFFVSLAQYSPINMGFQTIGFLYGKDFADAICKAVNCGWDTDCTGATVGATLGIILGARQLPPKWVEPLRDNISTNLSNGGIRNLRAPTDINILTDQVCALAPSVLRYWGSDTTISQEAPVDFPAAPSYKLDPQRFEYRPNALTWDLHTLEASIEYDGHAAVFGETPTHFTVRLQNTRSESLVGRVTVTLPPRWKLSPSEPIAVDLPAQASTSLRFTLTAPSTHIADTNRGSVAIALNERPALPSLPLVLLGGNRWLVSPVFHGDLDTPNVVPEEHLCSTRPDGWKECWRPGNDLAAEELFDGKRGVVYLLHWIHSDVQQELIFGVSNNGRMKLWLNGVLQHTSKHVSGLRPNQGNGGGDGANYKECTLTPGMNQVLIKLEHPGKPFEAHFTLGRPDRKYFKCLGHAVLGLGRARFPWDQIAP